MSSVKEIKQNASLFIQLVIASVKGDDAASVGIKIQKTAIAQIRAQVAAKNAHTLTLEDNLELAEDALENARINKGELVTSGHEYIKALLVANSEIEKSKEAIKIHKEQIEFLSKQLLIISN